MSARDRAVVVDLSAMTSIGLAVCLASDHLAFMTALVVLVLIARTWLVCTWASARLLPELLFLALCTVIGGANDWNTVVRHGVYAYTVTADHPAFSTIPTWMLLYWGVILRAIAQLAAWPRLGDARVPEGPFARPWPRVAAQLAIVLATRQAIYRLWAEAWWSWLPFAVGLALYFVVIKPSQRARRLALIALFAGPPVEIAFIQLGHLHRYALGWLGGVPVWIALWWALGVLVWSDLGPRLEARTSVGELTPARPAPESGA